MFEPRSYRIFSYACFVNSTKRDRIRDTFKIIGFSEEKILLKPKVLSSNPKDFFCFSPYFRKSGFFQRIILRNTLYVCDFL